MLRTNLSTRPFYNERGVRSVLALLALLALALTLFNIYEILRLQGQSRDARQMIAQNDQQARDLRQKAQDVRRGIDKVKLDAVQTAAREANALIDRRTLSWTELLNYFQTTLPPDVRIGGVSPQVDSDGRRLVQMTVFARKAEDLEEFMDALEKTGAFSGVLPRTQTFEDNGTLRSDLQAYYLPVVEQAPPPATKAPAEQAGTPPAASEHGSGPGNTSAGAPR